MIAYIKGEITFKCPTYVYVETGGVGYQLHISLFTYEQLGETRKVTLQTYHHVKEDAQLLFGFFTESEKILFTHLISVSGIGPNTARMMLSSMNPDEIAQAIIHENLPAIQRIKGIGPKSAKRLILELKDKLIKEDGVGTSLTVVNNSFKEEALSALVMLGFAKQTASKAINKIMHAHPETDTVEGLIKLTLKNL